MNAPAGAVGYEFRASRQRLRVLSGRGGEHAEILAQVEDVALVWVDVGEVGVGARYQLEQRRRRPTPGPGCRRSPGRRRARTSGCPGPGNAPSAGAENVMSNADPDPLLGAGLRAVLVVDCRRSGRR